MLPKGVETFDLIDGVWVTTARAALPVAMMLRQGLLQVSQTRALSEGQHTKTEMVYQYLTGPRFKQRVEANLTLSGLSRHGELNVDVLDHMGTAKLSKWFDARWGVGAGQ